jgi:hypothetical protein
VSRNRIVVLLATVVAVVLGVAATALAASPSDAPCLGVR